MPELLLILFVLVVRTVAEACKAIRKLRATKLRPLCTDCAHAHVQYTVNGRLAIACTFAGTVRPVTIDVMYCTDYRDRNAPVRVVSVGFVREIGDVEPLAEVASTNY